MLHNRAPTKDQSVILAAALAQILLEANEGRQSELKFQHHIADIFDDVDLNSSFNIADIFEKPAKRISCFQIKLGHYPFSYPGTPGTQLVKF